MNKLGVEAQTPLGHDVPNEDTMSTDLLPIPAAATTTPPAIDHARLHVLLGRLLASAGSFTPDGSIPQEANLQLLSCATYYHYQHGLLRRGRIGIEMDQAAANWWTMVALEKSDPRSLSREEWLLALHRLSHLIVSKLMPGIQSMHGCVMIDPVENFRAPIAQGIWVGISCEEGSVGVLLEPSVVHEFPVACV